MKERMKIFLAVLIAFFVGVAVGSLARCGGYDENQVDQYWHHIFHSQGGERL